MGAPPSVYIILLNWNGWRDTLRCVDSVRKLQYGNCKLIVVDNASDDDSVRELKNHAHDYVLLESPANLGFSGGNNIGIRHALKCGAEYLLLLNNDTEISADAVDRMVRRMENQPDLGALGGVIHNLKKREEVLAYGGGKVDFVLGSTKHLTGSSEVPDYLTGACLMVRSKVLREIGLLDENFFMYWEDVDLSLRIVKSGWRLGVEDASVVFHEESSSIGKGSLKMDQYLNYSAAYFFCKHLVFPWVPIVIGTTLRVGKRLVLLRPAAAMVVLTSALKGLRAGLQLRRTSQ